jgi:hypothetical protein
MAGMRITSHLQTLLLFSTLLQAVLTDSDALPLDIGDDGLFLELFYPVEALVKEFNFFPIFLSTSAIAYCTGIDEDWVVPFASYNTTGC